MKANIPRIEHHLAICQNSDNHQILYWSPMDGFYILSDSDKNDEFNFNSISYQSAKIFYFMADFTLVPFVEVFME